MKKCIKLAVVVATLGLSGCFESKMDLIGNHGISLLQFESLITMGGSIYRIDRTEEGDIACELRLKTDDEHNCWEQYALKFERSRRGNLIVQAEARDAKFLDEGDRIYLLVVRQPNDDTAGCFYILGADVDGETTAVEQAAKDIMGPETDKSIDRAKLMRIVNTYEEMIVPVDEGCPNHRFSINYPQEMVLEGDVKSDFSEK